MTIEPGKQSTTEQPKDEASGRFICSSAHPMPKPHQGRWMHPEAKDDGRNDPYYDHYKCPACGLTFSVEVAE